MSYLTPEYDANYMILYKGNWVNVWKENFGGKQELILSLENGFPYINVPKKKRGGNPDTPIYSYKKYRLYTELEIKPLLDARI